MGSLLKCLVHSRGRSSGKDPGQLSGVKTACSPRGTRVISYQNNSILKDIGSQAFARAIRSVQSFTLYLSKFRAFMKKPPLFLLSLALGALSASPVWAEKADQKKDMVFEADSMRIDDVKQVTTLDGNVVMTKGTILVRSAHIVVRQDADGYQFSVMTGTPEKPTFFRQKREGVDEFIEVESERIDYDGRADVVKFTGKAKLRRLRGAVLADEISGALIVYENLTDKFSVDGAPAGTSTAGTPPVPGSGRVRAILTPKPDATAPAAPLQGKAASQPGPNLRPSNTLGSTPQ